MWREDRSPLIEYEVLTALEWLEKYGNHSRDENKDEEDINKDDNQ